MNKLIVERTQWLLAIMLLSCVGCSANPNSFHTKCVNNDSLCVHRDSVNIQGVCCGSEMLNCQLLTKRKDTVKCVNCFNDSIINIIKKSRKIVCKLGVKNPKDSIRMDTVKVLPRKLSTVLKYLLSDSENYKSNDIVYGTFSPIVCYKFYKSKKICVYVRLDFGLRKMQILNINKELLSTYDIKENNLQLLRFARTLFPNDLTLIVLQNNLKHQ